LTGGNGFVGGQGFGNIDPLRLRLNAIFRRATRAFSASPTSARSRAPMLRSPLAARAHSDHQHNRRRRGFGEQQCGVPQLRHHLNDAPHADDDDTIILQIRADVTNIDPTTAVNLGGAIFPAKRCVRWIQH
jgi:hypothetical protein